MCDSQAGQYIAPDGKEYNIVAPNPARAQWAGPRYKMHLVDRYELELKASLREPVLRAYAEAVAKGEDIDHIIDELAEIASRPDELLPF